MDKTKRIIISLGGSLIVPDNIDDQFLRVFKKFIEKHIRKGLKFIIVTGGGKTSRRYQASAEKLVNLSADDLDWLGIHATRLNAHLIRTIFREHAHPVVIKNPVKKISTSKPIIVATGWKPGWSTDYVSVRLSETYNTKTILNLSNIDYAYTSDPKKNKNAKKITDITWIKFQKIVGTKWKPGANLPFDPVASKLAKKHDTSVYFLNGMKIKNIENVLAGKCFIGTYIHNKNVN